MKQKYIIGLGCSWTQGEGGYPQEVVDAHDGYTQCRPGQDHWPDSDYYLRVHELENSWVNQLCKYHFPQYKSLNLGIKGIGNQAAVGQLNFADQIDFDNSEGIVILMLSGMERFDIIQQRPMDNSGFDEPDGYSLGEYRHTKWRTAWPFESQHGDKEFWGTYARHLWSDQMVATHQLMALLNLQTWAKAYGYKVIIANAFNQHHWNSHLIPSEVGSGIELYLKLNCGALHKKFDWASCDFHRGKDYISFMQKLVELDGKLSKDDWCQFNNVYNPGNMKTHSTYLTNDQGAHPTIKGYRVIADELAEFIRERGYVEES